MKVFVFTLRNFKIWQNFIFMNSGFQCVYKWCVWACLILEKLVLSLMRSKWRNEWVIWIVELVSNYSCYLRKLDDMKFVLLVSLVHWLWIFLTLCGRLYALIESLMSLKVISVIWGWMWLQGWGENLTPLKRTRMRAKHMCDMVSRFLNG